MGFQHVSSDLNQSFSLSPLQTPEPHNSQISQVSGSSYRSKLKGYKKDFDITPWPVFFTPLTGSIPELCSLLVSGLYRKVKQTITFSDSNVIQTAACIWKVFTQHNVTVVSWLLRIATTKFMQLRVTHRAHAKNNHYVTERFHVSRRPCFLY